MNNKICEYVAQYTEPYFFSTPNDETLDEIHKEVQDSIETATDVMTFDIDPDLMLRAQAVLAARGWTLEEACILFLYWLIECPETAAAWNKAYENRETSQESPKESTAGDE